MTDTSERGAESGEGAGDVAPGVTARAGTTPEELAAVRELALRAHPDAVAELVGGGSVAEVVASLEPARAAYRRIAATIAPGAAVPAAAPSTAPVGPAVAPPVPAGAAPRPAAAPDALPAGEKIRRGLAGRSRQ